jgi:two-component system sensor histidine kinase CpxA
MDRAAEQIAEGHFDIHVAADRSDELGHLGAQINRTAARLSSFVTGQKRFLGDIAHELCAPIARIQFAVGILEQKAEAGSRQYVTDLREEAEHMAGLVNELLLFSKAGIRPADVELAPVNLAATVARVLSRETSAPSRVQTSIDPALHVLAHEAFLNRSLANLVRNALRYAGDAGPITVSARRDHEQVVITVADSGPGLPEEALDKVFEPFYRPEASRCRETGGVGLGLAIVKSGIECCRGSVVCRNRTPSGLEVAIRLPVASPQRQAD